MRNVKKNTPRYIDDTKRYLAWWADRLRGADLRNLDLHQYILPAMEAPAGERTRARRLATLKALYSWLRTVRYLIKPTEDPLFGRMPIPQSRPAQLDNMKAIPREHYLLARTRLIGTYRDALDVLAGTGWHVTALERFARSGRIEPYPQDGVAGIAGVLVTPLEKDGELHPQ